MSEELDLFIKIFDSIGSFGILVLIVLALFRGWVTPIAVQVRIEALHERNLKEVVSLHTEIHLLQQKRIEALETIIKEKDTRVEQGIHMLTSYIEIQDKLSRVTDQMRKENHE